MAYSDPRTWVTGELVTAALMNAQLRDNLDAVIEGTTGAYVNAVTGPHAIGGSTVDYVRLGLTGAFTSGGASTVAFGLYTSGVLTGHSADSAAIAGTKLNNSVVTAGNCTTIAQLWVSEPQITVGAGAVTNSAAVYIEGAASEATNDYALWVDAGATKLDGTLGVGGATTLDSTLGVGQSSPDGTVHIETGSAGSISFQGASDDLIVEHTNHAGITVATPADKEGSLMFLGPTTTDLGIIAYNQGTPGFQFHVANAKKATITAHGLCFGNDTADANALDDYEEGTWTPVLTGTTSASGVVYDTQTGVYTKVGNRVTFNVTVNLSNKGTIAGYLKITGLPFTNGVGQNGITTTKASNVVMGNYFKAWAPVYGSSAFMYLFMVKENVDTGTSQMDTDEITNNTEFEITGSYSV